MTHSATRLALLIAAAWCVVASPARACSFDNEDQSFSLDTLDHYYPNAYAVVLAMVDARRDGSLTRLLDPQGPKLFMFQRLLRVVRSFEGQVRDAARALPEPDARPPAFSLLLVESMLWVRFGPDIATRPALAHATGPEPGDVVAVIGDDALAALAAGRFDLAAAEQKGYVQLHGPAAGIASFRRVYSHVGATAAAAASAASVR